MVVPSALAFLRCGWRIVVPVAVAERCVTSRDGGSDSPFCTRHSRRRVTTSPWMARWLSRSSSFTAMGRKSFPDSVFLSRRLPSASSKRSARSHTDASGRRRARAWTPRMSSRISTSFSRNACGSRAGSLRMARSCPALSRASPRKFSRRAASTCMTSLSTSERRASGGSMIEAGSGSRALGRDAACAVSVEVMVVARCCATSGLPVGVGAQLDRRQRQREHLAGRALRLCRGWQYGQRWTAALRLDETDAAGMESSVTSSERRMAVLALSEGIMATGDGGGGAGAAGNEVASPAGGVATAGCSAAPVSRLLAGGDRCDSERRAGAGLAGQAPGEGVLVERRHFDGVRHDARRGDALDRHDDVMHAAVDHQAREANRQVPRAGVHLRQRILRGVDRRRRFRLPHATPDRPPPRGAP